MNEELYVIEWQCPFCKEKFNEKLYQKTVDSWIKAGDCPKCDYHNPFMTGSMEFIQKFCEPC